MQQIAYKWEVMLPKCCTYLAHAEFGGEPYYHWEGGDTDIYIYIFIHSFHTLLGFKLSVAQLRRLAPSIKREKKLSLRLCEGHHRD